MNFIIVFNKKCEFSLCAEHSCDFQSFGRAKGLLTAGGSALGDLDARSVEGAGGYGACKEVINPRKKDYLLLTLLDYSFVR